jgi:hypothetical protein
VQRSSMKRRALAVIVAAGTMTTLLGTVPARAATGTLKLFAQNTDVTVIRHSTRPVFLDADVFAEAVGGDFEIHVARADYASPIVASQWSNGSWVQDLDPSLQNGWFGLANFLHVTVRNPAGNVIVDRDQSWCPGGFDIQRVNDNGPDIPRLPQFGCYAMPFTLGTVWGVDQGWASPVSSRNGNTDPIYVDGHDGAYKVKYTFPQTVIDEFGIDPGNAVAKVTVHLQTSLHRSRAATASPAVGSEVTAPRVPTDLTPDPSTVPDLIPLPAFGMRIYNPKSGGAFLAFGANIWNAGPAPMVVEGFRRQDSDVMDAFEYFYDGDTPVSRAPVGTFEYDRRKGHHHWHMEQFAQYSLLNADQTQVVLSEKQSFCLFPTDAIDLTRPGAEWNPVWYGGGGLTTACGGSTAIWIREALPVGWGDTYFQYVGGQSFSIKGLPNGRYWIQVSANPTGSMIEADSSNNTTLRRVVLRGTPGHRRVVVPPYMGIDSESCWFCFRYTSG